MPRLQSERRMRHRKIWVECDNTPENAYSLSSDLAQVRRRHI
jgi:hypothetical protein